MKRLIILTLLLFLFASNAYADNTESQLRETDQSSWWGTVAALIGTVVFIVGIGLVFKVVSNLGSSTGTIPFGLIIKFAFIIIITAILFYFVVWIGYIT